MNAPLLSRRRLVALSAVALGAGLTGRAARALPAWHWRGHALGGPASMVLHDADRERAQDAIQACVAEIQRLEGEFSLFQEDSAIRRLNRDGILQPASLDMLELLRQARAIHLETDGAFDVSVQPLWRHLAEHPDTAPTADLISRVGDRHLVLDNGSVWFARPDMAVTLNGIAQGYITDRVGDLLTRRGYGAVLMDLGEIRALAPKADGRAWRVGLPDGQTFRLRRGAMATSSGAGLVFSEGHNHLIDPRTGASSNLWSHLTVVTESASAADALSTAFSLMPLEAIGDMVSGRHALVMLRARDGKKHVIGQWRD